jgi:hypothetical protein
MVASDRPENRGNSVILPALMQLLQRGLTIRDQQGILPFDVSHRSAVAEARRLVAIHHETANLGV